MSTKDSFHKLIDTIEDEEKLRGYLNLIQHLNTNQTGVLWNTLNSEEKEELLIAYEESFDSNNLISHDQVKNLHTKWLGK